MGVDGRASVGPAGERCSDRKIQGEE